MVNVDIDPRVYRDLKQYVERNRLEYPSIKYFVQKVLMDKLDRVDKRPIKLVLEKK